MLDPDVLEQLTAPFAAATATMLDQIGLDRAAACLDLSRGPAGILDQLSARIGPQGRAVGPVGERPPAGFDLVHARFRGAFEGRQGERLRDMIALARPGGVVAVQEPVAGSWRCYPSRAAWDHLLAAITTAVERAGGDLSAGRSSYRLFRRAGLEDVRVRAAVVALQDAHPLMRLPIVLATALRPQIVAGGLMTGDELDAALRDCERSALDGETFVTSFLVTQVWGRRAEA
jgi:hypothetical protein